MIKARVVATRVARRNASANALPVRVDRVRLFSQASGKASTSRLRGTDNALTRAAVVCHVCGMKIARIRHVLRLYLRQILQISGYLMTSTSIRVTVVTRRIGHHLLTCVKVRHERGRQDNNGFVRCPLSRSLLVLLRAVMGPRSREGKVTSDETSRRQVIQYHDGNNFRLFRDGLAGEHFATIRCGRQLLTNVRCLPLKRILHNKTAYRGCRSYGVWCRSFRVAFLLFRVTVFDLQFCLFLPRSRRFARSIRLPTRRGTSAHFNCLAIRCTFMIFVVRCASVSDAQHVGAMFRQCVIGR